MCRKGIITQPASSRQLHGTPLCSKVLAIGAEGTFIGHWVQPSCTDEEADSKGLKGLSQKRLNVPRFLQLNLVICRASSCGCPECFLLTLGSHPKLCSGFTPGSVLGDYPWQDLGTVGSAGNQT